MNTQPLESRLTNAQAEIYLHQKKHPKLPLFHIGGYVELPHAISAETFARAADLAFQKYDAFRLRITGSVEAVRQYDSGQGIELESIDFSGQPDAEAAALDWLQQIFAEPCVVEDRALMRHGLLKIAAQRFWYFSRAHHLATDGWGYTNWVRFLIQSYESLVSNNAVRIDSTPVSFLRHALSSRPHRERGLVYWSQKLADLPEPALHARAGVPPVLPSRRITLEFSQLDAVKAFCIRHGAGVQQYFLGLLHLYAAGTSRQSASVIGVVSHNRRTPTEKALVGTLLSRRPVVIRDVDGGYVALLKEIGRQMRQDYRYYDAPLPPSRGANGFEYQFNYQKLDYQLSLLGADTATHYLAHDYEQTPVVLTVCDYGAQQCAKLLFEYNLRYLDEPEAHAMLERLLQLNEQILADKNLHIRSLSLTSHADLAVYRQLNDTARFFPSQPLHQWIEAQARITPDAIALTDARKSYTYAQMMHSVRQLANALRARGIRKGDCVGVYLQRHCEMVISLLALWEAGAAYVPMDPEFPLARLQMMVEDSECSFLLSEDSLRDNWRQFSTLVIDLFECLAASEGSEATEESSRETLAYVLFTSGTTGRPKGIAVSHAALSNFMHSMSQRLSLTPVDRLLALTTLSFDISILELFLPLLNGARVIVADASTRLRPRRIVELLDQHDVTMLQATPSLWRLLLEHEWPRREPLKMLCGGEALPVALARQLLSKPGELWNLYGPTEATIWSSAFKVVDATRPVSLGQPLSNVRYYVIDARDRLCPVGVAGELCIAGRGLAAGYHRQPERTAEKFVELRMQDDLRERIYKTGDQVILHADGTLTFLGRLDHQVKLRGLRIELDDIACTLESHPHVRRAAVTIRRRADVAQSEYLCAHYEAEAPLPIERLRNYLSEKLSSYMVPNVFVWVEEIPWTNNGKRDLKSLPEPDEAALASVAFEGAENSLERLIASVFGELLKVDAVGVTTNFFDLGATSADIISAADRIQRSLGREVDPLLLFEQPTIRAVARALDSKAPALSATEESPGAPKIDGDDIAIIGMSGYFPGAKDVDELWSKLLRGESLIRRFTKEELAQAGIARHKLESESYVPTKGVLNDVYGFDNEFFGYTSRDAGLMDPQLRVFHEVVWHALEDAGLANSYENRRCGLFAGAGCNHFWVGSFLPEMNSSFAENYDINTLNSRDFLCTRVAYALNLKGPAVTVQTACSTSLMAVHLASQALRNGDCDIAIAGGVAVHSGGSHETAQQGGYVYQDGMILSPDGVCRPFDVSANGTVASDGAAVVVLKRLADAIADRDSILAVIQASAINNDGRHKIGFTAPSASGQSDAIARAVSRAGITAGDVSFIETHGTGTPLGDPIEVNALATVYADERSAPVYLGALKANVGHLDAAAGVAGLIKTVQVLRHGQIPPAQHVVSANPRLKLDERRFALNAEIVKLPERAQPYRAAVSAFGIGGSNVHMVLQQSPRDAAPSHSAHEPKRRILPLSAKSPAALAAMRTNLVEWIGQCSAPLSDVGYSLSCKRRHFSHRCALVCEDISYAAQELANPESPAVVTGLVAIDGVETVFLFPGQGSQSLRMGRELYRQYPSFKADIDRYLVYAAQHSDSDLRSRWFGSADAADLTATEFAQPLLFIFELALARLLMSWGMRPDAMLGHSVGEYVAACIAGVFTEQEGVALIVARARLMQSAEPGAMLSLAMSRAGASRYLSGSIELAAVNSSELCVLAGPSDAIASLQDTLRDQGIEGRLLKTSHAFHTRMMEEAAQRFASVMSGAELRAPTRRFLSNLTGTWITAEQATSPAYWAQHLRQPVLFEPALAELLRSPGRLFMEVGPGRTLSTFVRRHAECSPNVPAIELIPAPPGESSEQALLLNGVCKAYVNGVDLDWSAMQAGGHYVRLPLYPYQHRHYPPKPAIGLATTPRAAADRKLLFKPQWTRHCPAAVARNQAKKVCLIVAGAGEASELLIAAMRAREIPLVVVRRGARFESRDDREFLLDVSEAHHLKLLLAELIQRDLLPEKLIHLGGFAECADIDTALSTGYFSVLAVLNALAGVLRDEPLDLVLITEQSQLVSGEEQVVPARAALMGALRVAGQERANLRCRLIDLHRQAVPPSRLPAYDEQLLTEIMAPCGQQIVALRGAFRWTRSFTPVDRPDGAQASPIKQGGVYLITGGLGGVGLHLARSLAKSQPLTLVLTSRTPLPERSDWNDWLARYPQTLRAYRQIQALQELEQLGCKVDYIAADVTKQADVARMIETVIARHGAINGVIHAAGLPGGRAIWRFDPQASLRVMAPKIHGAEYLLDALDAVRPDFVYLMSSITALVGGFGQADYCAANAYLDALAHAAISRRNYPVQSINWDTWDDTGMARESTRLELPEISHAPVDRLLGERTSPSRFTAEVLPEQHWVFSEHWVLGKPTVAGATYLELIRQALHRLGHEGPCIFEGVDFLQPLAAAYGEPLSLHTEILDEQGSLSFAISSQPPGREERVQHAAGRVRLAALTPPPAIDLRSWESRCSSAEYRDMAALAARVEMPADAAGLRLIEFGPRWHCLEWIKTGDAIGLAKIVLPEAYRDDLATHALHPALLDCATGFLRPLLEQGTYLPLSYARLTPYRSLPVEFYSCVSNIQHDSARGTVRMDVTLIDRNGAVLAAIEGFVLRSVDVNSFLRQQALNRTGVSAARGRLSIEQALKGFSQIGGLAEPQIIVTHTDLQQRIDRADKELTETDAPKAAAVRLTPRPNLSTPYVKPRTPEEKSVEGLWKSLLGVETVGINDDFFELGGHSLLLAQFHNRLKKEFVTDITVAELYTQTTIGQIAARLARKAAAVETLVAVEERAKKQIQARERRRRGAH